jgi:hypothetical protein
MAKSQRPVVMDKLSSSVLIVHMWLDRVGWMCWLLFHLLRYGCLGTNMLMVCRFEEARRCLIGLLRLTWVCFGVPERECVSLCAT